MKEVILFLAHEVNAFTISQYILLKNASREYRKVIWLYDADKLPFPIEYSKEIEHYSFTIDSLNLLGFHSITDTVIPGSNHFPLFSFFREHPEYDYYWIIEYDVFFNGEWDVFFSTFQEEPSDFITSHIKFYKEDPQWIWWDSFQQTNQAINKEPVKSFNPIYRLSNKGVCLLDKYLRDGNKGHHEVLIPSVLYNSGYSLFDLATNAASCIRTYNSPFCSEKTMKYRPVRYLDRLKREGMLPNQLYHPVKGFASQPRPFTDKPKGLL